MRMRIGLQFQDGEIAARPRKYVRISALLSQPRLSGSEAGRLILQNSQSKAAIITCLRVANLRLGLLELRLAELDN